MIEQCWLGQITGSQVDQERKGSDLPSVLSPVPSMCDDSNRLLVEVFITRRADLKAVAARIVGRFDIVDDVMQDAYLKLEDCSCSCEISKPYGYCRQVVRNTALDYYRRQIAESEVIVLTGDGELPEIAGGFSADAGIDERRILKRIESLLAELPERKRRVFESCRIHGMTQRETAEVFGVSVTAVNFVVKEVTGRLSQCLQEMLE